MVPQCMYIITGTQSSFKAGRGGAERTKACPANVTGKQLGDLHIKTICIKFSKNYYRAKQFRIQIRREKIALRLRREKSAEIREIKVREKQFAKKLANYKNLRKQVVQ